MNVRETANGTLAREMLAIGKAAHAAAAVLRTAAPETKTKALTEAMNNEQSAPQGNLQERKE